MLFDLTAHQNPFLKLGQTTLSAVLSLRVSDALPSAPALLALALIIDRSASMEGQKIRAAKEAARQVVSAADDSVMLTLVAFNERAQLLSPPTLCTAAGKRAMLAAIDTLHATGGTCMSTGLLTAVDKLKDAPAERVRKILFLTDGKNEGEKHVALERAVGQCREYRLEVTAWGVGTAWDERELRYIATETLGNADIIPSADQVAYAFANAFTLMQKTAATQVRVGLWTPVGANLKAFQQVYPDIVPLRAHADPNNPRMQFVSLGSVTRGEMREYLVTLDVPAYGAGQQYLMGRPSLLYVAGTSTVEEKSERKAWLFAQWTADPAEAGRVDPFVAHYSDQEELTTSVQRGQEALAGGDRARATQLLGRALELSQQVGNAPITRLLEEIVTRDANGTVRLNDKAGQVARKTLAINATRTSRLS